MGAAVPASVELAAPAPSVFRLLTVDDEQRPIPGAVVLVDDDARQWVSDEAGGILLPSTTAGDHRLRAWAPAYYRVEESMRVAPNETGHLILKRRPDDKVFATPDFKEGSCTVAARTDLSTRTCGSWSIMLAIGTVADSETQFFFHRLDLTFDWTRLMADATPQVEIRLAPSGAFPDGRSAITMTGRGPHRFDLSAANLSADLLDGTHRIEFTAGAMTDGQPRVLVDAAFHAKWHVAKMYKAPPNPSWTE